MSALDLAHHDWLTEASGYLADGAARLLVQMEEVMSTESDAAKAEVEALKNDLETVFGQLKSTREDVVAATTARDAALAEAAEDKQALIDLKAEVSAIRDHAATLVAPPAPGA